jgi:DNA-binding CsgD family transcriptional regulator
MNRSQSDRNGKAYPPGDSSNSPEHRQSVRLQPLTPLTSGEVVVEGRRYRLVPVEEIPVVQNELAVRLLTGRELQIVALVAAGRVNKQIASELDISEWTVSTHLRRIFSKLGVDTRAAMVSKCAAMSLKIRYE